MRGVGFDFCCFVVFISLCLIYCLIVEVVFLDLSLGVCCWLNLVIIYFGFCINVTLGWFDLLW